MPKGKKKTEVYAARGFKVATQHDPKLRKDIAAMSDAEKRKKARSKLEKRVATGLSKAFAERIKRRTKAPTTVKVGKLTKNEKRRKLIQTHLDKQQALLKKLESATRVPMSVRMGGIVRARKRIKRYKQGLADLKTITAKKTLLLATSS